MKLIRYEPMSIGSASRLGCIINDGGIAIDVSLAYAERLLHQGYTETDAKRLAERELPPSLDCIIRLGDRTWSLLEETVEWAKTVFVRDGRMDIAPTLPLSEIRLRSPLERPALIRDFMVYEGHMQNVYPKLGREIPGEWYNFPSYYKGNPSSVSGPGDTVNLPRYAELLDYECELACVVRKPALNVLSRDAEKHIAGYMLYNDLSARGYQSREMTIGLGPAKGKDFLGGHVLGPILVTPDEISDIYNQTVEISINDTLISRCSTRGMRWNFADLIAYASYDEYVAAGEVFGSGTLTGGSGIESGRMLREGDRIKIYSHNLGALTTYIGPRIDQPNDVPHPEGVRSLLG